MSIFGGMKIYTVHIKPGMANAQARPVFVKEGFNFWAFLFTDSLGALSAPVATGVADRRLQCAAVAHAQGIMCSTRPASAVIHLGFHLVVGFWGNDWLRARLARRGYIMADISVSDSLLRAEQRYFERYVLSPRHK